MKKNEYLMYVLDILQPHGPITAKAMFGGYGIYFGPVIIAVIVDNELFFKVDERTKPLFEAQGAEQWVYEGKTKRVAMPYMKLPEELFSNRDELPTWIQYAHEASVRQQKTKKA